MRALPPALREHLDSGTTTLCTCWRLTRRDGIVFGFTDHDRDLIFEGTRFEAASGFTATEARETVGTAVDNLEIEGALSSLRLDPKDLAGGVYDDARVEIWRVNWERPEQRVRLRVGWLGDVTHTGSLFRAEVRGVTHHLQQQQGRLYQYGCDADLGDNRCGIDLTTPAYRGSGTVTSVPVPSRLMVSGLTGFVDGWFSGGLLTWSSGADAGRSIMVRTHRLLPDSVVSLDLWQEPPLPITPGWTFAVTAGCDKSFATCRAKFANGLSFRGFPHMPGNDFVTGYPNRDDGNLNGQSRNR